jgi:hypothetical protein
MRDIQRFRIGMNQGKCYERDTLRDSVYTGDGRLGLKAEMLATARSISGCEPESGPWPRFRIGASYYLQDS